MGAAAVDHGEFKITIEWCVGYSLPALPKNRRVAVSINFADEVSGALSQFVASRQQQPETFQVTVFLRRGLAARLRRFLATFARALMAKGYLL